MNFSKSIDLAQKGDAEAQYKIAEMYWSGYGAAIDTDKAWYWCNRAAKKGHSKAIRLMGVIVSEITEGRVRLQA